MSFARKGLQQVFVDGPDKDDDTSALPMSRKELRNRNQARSTLPPFSTHETILPAYEFLGVVLVHFTTAVKDHLP